MRSPKIIEGEPFDWEAANEAMDNVQREDGSVNWRAAFSADPGCTECPTCETFFWREGKVVECLECGTWFTTDYPPEIVRSPQ